MAKTPKVKYGQSVISTFISEDNPFAAKSAPSNIQPRQRSQWEPGTPWWWLDRLVQKLMDRMERYDTLENYALGYHPLPNLDYRYVKALRDLQKKARTNYCELVIRAVVERMKVKGFRFGPVGSTDADAKRIWDFNEMDYQSPLNINTAATFGFCYALVSPPDPKNPESEPSICIEDPRTCITERNPYNPTKSIAGLKIWVDDVLETTVAMLYLPDYVYTFSAAKHNEEVVDQDAYLTKQMTTSVNAADFELVLIQNNDLGEVPLIEGRWQPSFGDIGRSEHEGVLDIQDRINHQVLDRLIVSKSQAYRQRWVSGVNLGNKRGKKASPWDPGADVLWITPDKDAQFGDFDAADITQLLEAVKDDVGDMAAISQTPSTYLMNRVANVSGDTMTQAQAGLISKTRLRFDAMGHFYELVMRTCFKYKNDPRAKDVHADVIWADPEVRSMLEMGDVAVKFTAAGIPLQLTMERLNFSPDEIEFAVKERDRIAAEQQAREDAVAKRDTENSIAQERAKPKPSSSAK